MPSYKPPADVARAARRALEIRRKLPASRRGGTAVGVRRAAQLARRDPVSLETLQRMASFFARHGKSPGSAEARQDRYSKKAAQAWGLWAEMLAGAGVLGYYANRACNSCQPRLRISLPPRSLGIFFCAFCFFELTHITQTTI